MKELDSAVEHFTAAIDRGEDMAEALWSRGWVHCTAGRWIEAVCDFEIARELSPGTLPHYREHLEVAYRQLGMEPEGIESPAERGKKH